MNNSLGKKERLKSEKIIKKLFDEGSSVGQFPLRLFYIEHDFEEDLKFKVAVSVSKKTIKSAVKRNRVKRLLREAYRLNKSIFFNNSKGQYALMILYLGKDVPNYELINSKLKLLFGKFSAITANEKEI